MFILIVDKDMDALVITEMPINELLDVDPADIENILKENGYHNDIESVKVYELLYPITFEKNTSYTVNQD